jgi:hypothetical protein
MVGRELWHRELCVIKEGVHRGAKFTLQVEIRMWVGMMEGEIIDKTVEYCVFE